MKDTDRVKDTQHAAHALVSTAVRTGLLVPAASCEVCGYTSAPGERRLDAHHPRGYDLAHALDVEWLCRGCHSTAHLEQLTPEQRAQRYADRAAKAWETRRRRYGPTGLSSTPRVNARK